MITVNVKFHSNCSVCVNIGPQSSLIDVKREISHKLNVPLDEVRVILGGKLLSDDCALQDLNIGDQSTLHIFRQTVGKERSQELVNAACDATALKNHYYVYCKECRAVQPGKLRVNCAACKDGAFVLQRDPENWNDVLQSTQISGTCKNIECGGMCAKRGSETCIFCIAKMALEMGSVEQNLFPMQSLHYDWHKPMEFLFKCVVPHPDSSSGGSVVLHHVRPNRREVECITCADIRSPVLVFPCESGHVMCLECFKMYGITQLSERKFVKHSDYGYTLPCPAGCPNSEVQESHHFHLLGDQQYERFNQFATEEYVLQGGGVLCPGPGCGMGFVLDGAERKVMCVAKDCQMVFCRDCKNEYHEGACDVHPLVQIPAQDYAVDPDLAERARWETQSKSLIERTTKPCPKCSTRTERDGGCMHMVCTRCGEDWCWVCDKVWDRDCQAQHWFG